MTDLPGRSIPEITDYWSRRDPERRALGFAPDLRSGAIRDELTYGELVRRATGIADRLRERGLRPGDRVLLQFPPGLDFVTAFLGCLYARLIAVPAPPPERSLASIERVKGILVDAEPVVVLTDESGKPDIERWLAERTGQHVPCESVTDLAPTAAGDRDGPPVAPGDIALLQYSSGSTSDPKGSIITHANLVANLEVIHDLFGRRPAATFCGWLPLTHDMGLIGQLLYPLATGGWVLLLPPMEFVKRPYGWLELISRHGVEHAVAPNFAYDMCVRQAKGQDVSRLDLSRWRAAINAAEPVRARTIAEFAETFASAGFRREAFLPCYGLAEATLLVTGTPCDRAPRITDVDGDMLAHDRFVPVGDGSAGRPLVSSGVIRDGSLLIVDSATGVPLEDRQVGEVWVTGPSVSQGYWHRGDLNARTFGARTSDGGQGYLRTGDLGVRDGEELYVTGRIKDVIVLRGRNLYPQDLEIAVQDQAGDLRFCTGAVFGLDDDGDDIVVLQELRARQQELAGLGPATSRIRHELARQFGVGRTSVVFVRPSTVLRTTSGKIRRSEMRRLFLRSALTPIYQSLAPGVSERLEERV